MLAYKAVYLNHKLLARVQLEYCFLCTYYGSTFSVLFSFERSCGALAQLGERLLCTQEVSGSIPLGSIKTGY